ncbi:hypothetical protein ENKNEFLB_00912 [Nocardioides aquaticus]|uniref:Uncharacterized protein n=1 Tax=Nocardioides aquaticus TaxID=160826 RepID=A0ABX8EF72_9ACTN|nr:hypothetical protein [Nocardioides aquaticus]QVT78535.1 hypothetical protein ENKNEFLB_00912 [Nocardioides aquaticus]
MADSPSDPTQDEDGWVGSQLWPRYAMNHSISVAWLDPGLTPAHLKAFGDAWDVLVVREEWRAWVRTWLFPTAPFFVLTVRPELDVRRLRKTKSGVSMHLPAAEVFEADGADDLIALYVGVIHAIYSKWAQVSACPPPPPVAT